MLRVKNNQRDLAKAITSAPEENFKTYEAPPEKNHGRLTTRTLRYATAMPGQFDFPNVVQYAILETETLIISTNKARNKATHLIITDQTAEEAPPEKLLEQFRSEWVIENSSHYVRDVTFGEDRCRARTGNTPRTLATLRNLANGIFRLAQYLSGIAISIAAALQETLTNPTVLLTAFCLSEPHPLSNKALSAC